jgi:hypothetical protein
VLLVGEKGISHPTLNLLVIIISNTPEKRQWVLRRFCIGGYETSRRYISTMQSSEAAAGIVVVAVRCGVGDALTVVCALDVALTTGNCNQQTFGNSHCIDKRSMMRWTFGQFCGWY